MDDNIDNATVMAGEPTKVKQNMWNEAQCTSLVSQTYLDKCCPIGKSSHQEIRVDKLRLLDVLAEYRDGVFDDFNLSWRLLQRQLSTSV